MSTEYHEPVLLEQTIEALSIKPAGVYVDGTAGGAGHLREIASRLDERGVAVGIDRDPDAVARARERVSSVKARVIVRQSRYSRFAAVLDECGIDRIDGFLLDLGVSSHQIDTARRGFSYRLAGPLDMRMDPADTVTAEYLLNNSSADQLTRILGEYGEVRNPARMAAAIVSCRTRGVLRTSDDLTACLAREYGPNLSVKVAAKVFQSLRIAVNDELGELERTLFAAVDRLRDEGRLVVISYHSLEDRIVKNFMRDLERGCTCSREIPRCVCGKPSLLKRLESRAIRPDSTEIAHNPRSRSARLRAARKIERESAQQEASSW